MQAQTQTQGQAERYEFERNFPTPRTIERVFDEQDLQRAIEVYRFFYPAVSMDCLMAANREAGLQDGRQGMVLAAGPRHVIFTANSDTPYAAGVLDLAAMGPVVIDVPAGPYIALVDDHYHRWVVDMGIPGPDAGKGGKYLILPPNYDGPLPSGFHVARCETFNALVAARALPIAGDQLGALRALQQLKIHPLRDASAVMSFVDVTERPIDCTPLRIEDRPEFWTRLHAIIDSEPALPEYRPMYGLLAALGLANGKPFAPTPRTQQVLDRAARIGLDQMRVEGFANGRSDCAVWSDRHWEWVGLVPGDADFERPDFLDVQARDRWFVQAIVASPAMFRRKVGSGSVYFLAARDRTGEYFDGGHNYKLVIPQPVPAQLFWSVTAYDACTRSQVKTEQDKAVLGSLVDKFTKDPDGSIELYFGPTPPPGREGQWIRTAPGKGFFLYFRVYGPEAACFDGSWKLGDIVRT